jgi:CheY-like chemotaxis protein/PAS domain-containing protein
VNKLHTTLMLPRLATRSALLACAVLALLGSIVIAGWLVPRLALVHVLPPNAPLVVDLVLLLSSLVAAALVALVLYAARTVHERFQRAEEAARELARSQERYEAAQRGSFQGLWDWDIEAGRVDYAPHCKSLLGYAADDAVSDLAAWTSRIHPDDRERVTAAIDEHLVHRTPLDEEFRLVVGLAPPQLVRARGQAVWNALGIPVRMAGSLVDVSDRRRLEEELEQKTAELAAKDRVIQEHAAAAQAANQSKCELLANLGHEIRSPLVAILDNAELLLELEPTGEVRDRLLGIKRSGEELAAMLNVSDEATVPPKSVPAAALGGEQTGVAAAALPSLATWPDTTPAARAASAALPVVKKPLPLAGRRILLAEDSPDNQWQVTHHLQRNGAIVELVEDGLQAIAKAHAAWKSGRAFDAILMDMQMPVVDGYEATRRLRTQGYAFPILALTAQARSGDRQKCLVAGCDDYLPKPIRPPQLLAMLTACLARLDAAARDTQPVVEAL